MLQCKSKVVNTGYGKRKTRSGGNAYRLPVFEKITSWVLPKRGLVTNCKVRVLGGTGSYQRWNLLNVDPPVLEYH